MNVSVIGLLTTRGHQISHKDPLKSVNVPELNSLSVFGYLD